MNGIDWLIKLTQSFWHTFVEEKPPFKSDFKDIELTCQMLQGKFNAKNYERRISVAIIIIILFIFFCLSDIPGFIRGKLILRQKMPEMIYVDAELKNVLQDIVDFSDRRFPISACRDLAEKRVTVDIRKGTMLEDVLRKLCQPPDCKLSIWRGIDVLEVFPLFECADSNYEGRIYFSKSIDTKKH